MGSTVGASFSAGSSAVRCARDIRHGGIGTQSGPSTNLEANRRKRRTTMKKLLIGILLFTVTASGCVATQATMLRPNTPYAMVSPAQVQVFLREEDIRVPYDKIAIIYAQGESTMTNEHQMIAAAKEEAARVGA